MTNCEPKYKNLGKEAFSEGRYVTAQMLAQFCKNDAYLRTQTDDLWLEINPTSRKRLNPLPVDASLSYGVTIPNDNDKQSRLNNSTSQNIYIDFSDLTEIDTSASTCSIESLILNTETVQRATIPKKTVTSLDQTSRSYSPWARKLPDGSDNIDPHSDLTVNESWYVSFDRNRSYELRPHWLKNPMNSEIPGVCRAQTFKANATGLLESVTLNIKGDANNVPLTVCIMRTTTKGGVVYPAGTCDWSKGNPIMAKQEVQFKTCDPGVYTIAFEKPCTVQANEKYAIAVFANLAHQSTPYWLGGWSNTCQADPYTGGDAFLSENSGATWTRYGKPENVPYHYGQHAPQDFAFICNIRTFDNNKYIKDEPFYLYLKPIRCNPCNTITLVNPTGSGHDSNHTLEFEVSTDGETWTRFDNTGIISFADKPKIIFMRAVMQTATESTAPYLESFGLTLNTDAATEGYARLPYYYPPMDNMLSAAVWDEIYTPYLLDADTSITDCTVELISNKTIIDNYDIINPLDIKNYSYLPGLEEYEDDINALSDGAAATQYLTDNPDVLEVLRNFKTLVIGFITSIQLTQKAAYPMIACTLNTIDNGSDIVTEFIEFYDYNVDYEKDTVTFKPNQLEKGTLTIQYNPVIVSNIKNTDLPFRLDYIQETFIMGANDLINGEFPLKITPNDPISKLVLNDETELHEDLDYHIDYVKGVLILDNLQDTGARQYSIGDKLKITYTPAITENGLSIGYKLKRTNVSYNVNIGLDEHNNPTYISYKS